MEILKTKKSSTRADFSWLLSIATLIIIIVTLVTGNEQKEIVMAMGIKNILEKIHGGEKYETVLKEEWEIVRLQVG